MKVEPKYLVIGLIALGLFLGFVWPTPYQIYKHPKGSAYRVNRFTGVMEVSRPDGWKRGYINSAGAFRSGTKPLAGE